MNSVFPRAAQAGRTLIELLIAMTIGLVIVIGVSALYLSSSGLSRTANEISTVEQAAQLALLIIGDSLKMAAYGEIIGSDFAGQGQTLMDAFTWRAVPTRSSPSVPGIRRAAESPSAAESRLHRRIDWRCALCSLPGCLDNRADAGGRPGAQFA